MDQAYQPSSTLETRNSSRPEGPVQPWQVLDVETESVDSKHRTQDSEDLTLASSVNTTQPEADDAMKLMEMIESLNTEIPVDIVLIWQWIGTAKPAFTVTTLQHDTTELRQLLVDSLLINLEDKAMFRGKHSSTRTCNKCRTAQIAAHWWSVP